MELGQLITVDPTVEYHPHPIVELAVDVYLSSIEHGVYDWHTVIAAARVLQIAFAAFEDETVQAMKRGRGRQS